MEIATNGWVVGPVVFGAWLAGAFYFKLFAYRKIRAYVVKTAATWDDAVFDATNTPMNLLVFFVGLSIMQRIMPLNNEVDLMLRHAMKIVLLLIGIFFVNRLVRGLLVTYARRTDNVALSQGVVQGVVSGIVFLIGGLIILGSFGVNITPLLASLGVGSLAVALALQDTLANLFSGLFLTMDKAISVGDLVELTGEAQRGYIANIGWRSSQIRLRDNNLVVVPNKTLLDSIITNYSGTDERMRVSLKCGVHYDSDLRHVTRVATDVAQSVRSTMKEADKDFEPWIRWDEFGDSSINFTLVMGAMDYLAKFAVISELVQRLHERFNQEGIVIPFPLRTLDFQPKHWDELKTILSRENTPRSGD